MIGMRGKPRPSDLLAKQASGEAAERVGAINILAAGHAVLACGARAQSGRPAKQEPAESTMQEFDLVWRCRNPLPSGGRGCHCLLKEMLRIPAGAVHKLANTQFASQNDAQWSPVPPGAIISKR